MEFPDRWSRLEQLFHDACEQPEERRQAYVREQAAGDDALAREVISLLGAQGCMGDFLAGEAERGDVSPAYRLPRRVGAYRLIEEIDRGGMGIVYRAERADDQYRQVVALKAMKQGAASAEQYRRFLTERQILARLEHPHIARLLDGGLTEDGLPYLVMEFIDGIPIDRYCDCHRLSVTDRITLFLKVCDAVGYAHGNLIVHRDLKPPNILVNPAGEPKLLDFGVAKVLDPAAADPPVPVTGPAQRMATPAYASPEQMAGEVITTASDVYSLGVCLYELLCGRSPHGAGVARGPVTRDRIPRFPSAAVFGASSRGGGMNTNAPEAGAIAGARSTRPDALTRQLRGDLDHIVLMALRREPERRYSSVHAFADDLRRYLAALPVYARPDTIRYRMSRFLRRHAVGAGAAAMVLLALLVGLGFALWQSRIAALRRDQAIRAATIMVHELAGGLSRMEGPTESRLGLLDQAAMVFEAIAAEASPAPALRFQAIESRRMLAQTYRMLGEGESAAQQARRAVVEARDLLALDPVPENEHLLASALVECGHAEASLARQGAARQCFEEGIRRSERLTAGGAAAIGVRMLLCEGVCARANQLFFLSRLDTAAVYYRRAHALAAAILRDSPRETAAIGLMATCVERLADVAYYAGRVGESCRRYREGLSLRRRAHEAEPDNVVVIRSLTIAMQNAGWCAENSGDLDAGLRLYWEAIGLQERLLYKDPANVTYATALMGGYGTVGNALASIGRMDSARHAYTRALAVESEFARRGVHAPSLDLKTAQLSHLQAKTLAALGRFEEAEGAIHRASRLLAHLRAADPTNTEYARTLAYVLMSQAEVMHLADQLQAEAAALDSALAIRRRVASATGMSHDRQLVAATLVRIADVLERTGRVDGARDGLLNARDLLIELRNSGQLSSAAEGARELLPAIDRALKRIGSTPKPTPSTGLPAP